MANRIARWPAAVAAVIAIVAALPTLVASPRVAIAMPCTTSILGPNDPDYAPAELAPGTGLTFNVEDWYLFDCIPQSTPKATDPEGSSGMFFNQAWAKYGFGRSDLIVAYIEGGINWRQTETADLRRKAYLNCGELPAPERADGSTVAGSSPGCLEPGKSYDLDGDGVLTPDDYANDPRVARPFIHQGTAGGITSEDLIVAFSDGVDNDHNGYVDDISGWNFHRDTNDPQTDNSAYEHPDGESAQFVAEANNGLLGVGVCPNCRLLSIKAGDEAIDRPDRVAEAIAFAADSGAKVIDVTESSIAEAPVLAAAIDYAYQHGAVLVWASNDFESADHTDGMRFAHVWPGNSIVSDRSNRSGTSSPGDAKAQTFRSRSSLTSYGPHNLFSVPNDDGSTSTGTPTLAGVAAMVVSAGLDASQSRRDRLAARAQRGRAGRARDGLADRLPALQARLFRRRKGRRVQYPVRLRAAQRAQRDGGGSRQCDSTDRRYPVARLVCGNRSHDNGHAAGEFRRRRAAIVVLQLAASVRDRTPAARQKFPAASQPDRERPRRPSRRRWRSRKFPNRSGPELTTRRPRPGFRSSNTT